MKLSKEHSDRIEHSRRKSWGSMEKLLYSSVNICSLCGIDTESETDPLCISCSYEENETTYGERLMDGFGMIGGMQ